VRRRPHGAPQSPFYILPRAAGYKRRKENAKIWASWEEALLANASLKNF